MLFMMASQTVPEGQSLVNTFRCTTEFVHMLCGGVFR